MSQLGINILTELNTRNIPLIYERFCDLIGEKLWKAEVKKLSMRLKSRKYLKEVYETDFQIVYELSKCSKNRDVQGKLPASMMNDRSIYAGLAFAAQVLAVTDSLSPECKKIFVSRVKGALKDPQDMRSLRLELLVATHFAKKGLIIDWPELTEQDTSVDLLMPEVGPLGFEVECKAFSRDKGKRIPRVQALDFLERLKERALPILPNLDANLAVVLTIPDRLSKSSSDHIELADIVIKSILNFKETMKFSKVEISVNEIPEIKLKAVTEAKTDSELATAITAATDTHNEQALIMKAGAGTVVCVVRSAKDDSIGERIRDSIKKSAKNQASGKRPLFFVVSLQDLPPEDLIAIASEDKNLNTNPSILQQEASSLMDSTSCPYVVGISFLSGSAVNPGIHGIEESKNRSYSFVRAESKFASEEVISLMKLS